MAIHLHFVGREVESDDVDVAVFEVGSPSRSYDLSWVRRDVECDATALIEIEDDDECILWTTAEDLAEDEAARRGHLRGEGDADIALDALLAGASTSSRGVLRRFGRVVLRIFGRRVADEFAGRSAKAIAEYWEDKVTPGHGLYRCDRPEGPDAVDEAQRVRQGEGLPGDGPLLLLLHGTASSIAGSFSKLGGSPRGDEPTVWATLQAHYRAPDGRSRICAFQHPTLSASPIDNALQLVDDLPRGAELHLVTHSRGGLIGDLLCLAGQDPSALRGGLEQQYRRDEQWLAATGRDLDDPGIAALAEQDRADREALLQLLERLRDKGIRVLRYVRVACPAAGTSLASERLDRLLSLLGNLIRLLPPANGPFFNGVIRPMIRALVAQRFSPDRLPGLEAMLPHGPLVRWLNLAAPEVDAELAVIAGDAEGSGLIRRLGVLLLDRLIFPGRHDLVVDTRSMYEGLRRRQGVWQYFQSRPDISHFNYFDNADSQRALLSWLLETDGRALFRSRDAEAPSLAAETFSGVLGVSRGDPHRPLLFLLPGIMGSQLRARETRIWMVRRQILLGRITRLAYGRSGVETDGVFSRYYQALAEYLAETHEVHVFPYDWRLSIDDAARRLAAEVRRARGSGGRPVRFVAHSMGGLVARAMMAGDPTLWAEISEQPGSRLLMLGTPNRGSFAIVEALLGHDRLVRMLALLDLPNSLNRILGLLAEYPGVMDLLPQDGELDLYDVATWSRLTHHNGRFGHVPEAERLRGARLRRDRLPARVSGNDPIVYVAGQAPLTPAGIRMDGSGDGRLRFVGTTEGDGRVTHAAGELPGVPRWFCDAVHGDLPATRSAFPAYLDLLETGRTDRLPTEPLSRRRGLGAREFLYDPSPATQPDEATLIAEALGASGDADEEAGRPGLTVSLVYADLAQARHPVLCGHAVGDVISGAEAALDEALGGALSRRYQLDRIPGRVGSTAVILPDGSQRSPVPGAVVMGLGELGELSANVIAEASYAACLDYLLAVASPSDGAWVGLSAILVGGNSPAALHEADIIRSIIQGVVRANRAMVEQANGTGVAITELEILEHDGLRFQEACQFLRADTGQLSEELGTDLVLRREERHPEPRVETGSLAARRATRRWRRLIVTEQERPPLLNYELLGLRARIPGRAVDFDPVTVARLLAEAMSDPRFDRETANALYHLLIPNHLGDQIDHFDALMLIVDERTARLPFEMLSNNRRPGARPWAVRQAMVRQFRTPEFRQTLKPVRAQSALVLGDPVTPLPELPGARAEAQAVAAALLGQGYDVRLLLQPRGADVLRALFAKPWRILHVAGHGIHEADGEDPGALRNGILLDDGALLGRPQISELPETPDFVFLNCCHLGRMVQLTAEQRVRFQHFAGTIARSFINIGVRGLVVGGWEVNDRAAQRFAEVFYQALLNGEALGLAVLRARAACWAQFPDYNTWGAYQCYGDPDLRLV
ncbi:CHAT domain-containing protein [Alkalilimnicola ehrlichii]|uniref:CHAT domain-containing protein n=1 Tax=Alkalilimnicola ehrlichii TaxID=351052 RepID=UPI003BA0DC46